MSSSKVPSKQLPLPSGFFKFVILSRAILILMQVFFNRVLPDHESVDAFQSPYKLIPQKSSVLDSFIDFVLGGYARWDAQYFLHIATLGYTHENCLAFFPGLPLLTNILSNLLQPLLFYSINCWNAALLSSIIISNFCFIVASKYLYHITTIWLGETATASSSFATKTVILFVISPASIFFSAPYSESLFCALTFGGIYYCLRGKFFFSSILFALSTSTRSNGLLNIGFLVCFICIAAVKIKLKKLPTFTISVIPSILFSFMPFILYQYYAFNRFCHVHSTSLNVPHVVYNYLSAANFTIPGERVPIWCHQIIPLSYSSVQSHYWNVGFLRYFEWKQIPNFMLAMPILSLVMLHCFMLVNHLMHSPWMPQTTASLFKRYSMLLSTTKIETNHSIFRWESGIFALHATFLAVFTFLFAHVQISTRLIGSSSPVVYWIMAWLSGGNDVKEVPGQQEWSTFFLIERREKLSSGAKWIYFYCFSYTVVGIAMFANYLPWT